MSFCDKRCWLRWENAQGREIKGKLLYLGGPLTFLPALRKSFDEGLQTTGLCPENSLYFVALGCTLANVGQRVSPRELREKLRIQRAHPGQQNDAKQQQKHNRQ